MRFFSLQGGYMKQCLSLKNPAKTESRRNFLSKLFLKFVMQLFLSWLDFVAIIIILSFELFLHWIPHSKSEVLYQVILFPDCPLLETNWLGDNNRVTSHVIQYITNFCHLVPGLKFFQEIVALQRRMQFKVNVRKNLRTVFFYILFFFEGLLI